MALLGMMKRLLLFATIVLSGCGGPAATTPTGSSTPTSLVSNSSTTPTNTPTVGFSCRLPLAQSQPGGFQGIFVDFPAGNQAAGAGANLPPNNGATFTRRYGQWLPVPLYAVSPDSSHYAYADRLPTPFDHVRIHVVDVVSKVDQVVYSQTSSDHGYFVIVDYRADGIYVEDTGPAGESRSGLTVVNPVSGSLRTVAPVGQPPSIAGFQAIGQGAAWYTDLAPGDEPPFAGIDPADRLMRFDLTTKVATPWFRRAGFFVEVLGTDAAGHALVKASAMADSVTSVSESLWLVTGPNAATQVYAGPGSKGPAHIDFLGIPLEDAHGIWLGTDHGTYLWPGFGRLEKVSQVAGMVAGRCS
jgi:hypothetical protein